MILKESWIHQRKKWKVYEAKYIVIKIKSRKPQKYHHFLIEYNN
jgi:hypothetical protein